MFSFMVWVFRHVWASKYFYSWYKLFDLIEVFRLSFEIFSFIIRAFLCVYEYRNIFIHDRRFSIFWASPSSTCFNVQIIFYKYFLGLYNTRFFNIFSFESFLSTILLSTHFSFFDFDTFELRNIFIRDLSFSTYLSFEIRLCMIEAWAKIFQLRHVWA